MGDSSVFFSFGADVQWVLSVYGKENEMILIFELIIILESLIWFNVSERIEFSN